MLDVKKPIVSINLTPLVDVSLVLVVIFMATAPMFLQSGIIVTSGEKKAASAATASKPEANILIRLEGNILRLNQQIVSEADLPALLSALLARSESKRVLISPDREVRHGRVIWAMDTAKQAGAGALVIVGRGGDQAARDAASEKRP